MATISTSTSKRLTLAFLLIGFVSGVSADFYYNQGGSGFSRNGFSSDSFFSFPEYDSQKELVSGLVAPFLFISVLLHFALSRALSFILAEDIENDRHYAVPFAIPLRERHDEMHPDARKYAMLMSITITASLIPTPYWSVIRGVMTAIGTSTAIVLGLLMLYGFYKVLQALN